MGEEDKTKKRRKTKKKEIVEVKRRLIAKHLLDEGSDSFMNMTKAMIRAGYKKSYAESYCGEMWGKTNFTDILPKEAKSPQHFAQKIFNIFLKLANELDSAPQLTKVSAKYLVICDKILDKLIRIFGMEAPKREEKLSVNVIVPRLPKCPQCGYEMDIMKREYEGGEESGED